MRPQTRFRLVLPTGALHEFPSPEHAAQWLKQNPQNGPVWAWRRTVTETLVSVYGTPQSPAPPPVPQGLPALELAQETVTLHGLAGNGVAVAG